MKQIKQVEYLAPEIEVNDIQVEQGFTRSQLESPDTEYGEW